MRNNDSIITAYTDIRLLKILLIGGISGLPWVLHGAILTVWLQDEGFSRSAIGLFGYISVVYALNFLIAPLTDSIRIPVLDRWFGRRRSWIIVMQSVILTAIISMYHVSPSSDIQLFAILMLLIALASATQDIVIDAMRIELALENEQSLIAAGAAITTVGWYTGYNVGGAIALYYGDYLSGIGVSNPWHSVCLLMAGLVVLTNIALYFAKTADQPRAINSSPGRPVGVFLKDTLWMPFYDFFRRNGTFVALSLIAFIITFKIGEAFLGRMSLVFYRELGISDTDIATYSKLLGWGIIILFSVAGSFFSIRYGLLKGLIICGIAMASTNLMFAWLANVGPHIPLFAGTVIIDQFTTAISTVAFVAFISQLCNRAYTATQYALFASLGNFSRTTLSSHSGQVVDILNGAWDVFFIITSVMVIPSLVILWACRKRLGRYF